MAQYIKYVDGDVLRIDVQRNGNEWVVRVYNTDDEVIHYTKFSYNPDLNDINSSLYLW